MDKLGLNNPLIVVQDPPFCVCSHCACKDCAVNEFKQTYLNTDEWQENLINIRNRCEIGEE